ncbi:MAG: type II secretion system minor pseudopilin GspH [Steroidobacteraceae bacterium]
MSPRTRAAPRARPARGFTLVEILVVCAIIAVVAAGAVLSLAALGADRELSTETDRLVDLMNFARDRAGLETREFGLLCTSDGYQFLEFDPRTRLWEDLPADGALRARKLPGGVTLSLSIENQSVTLETAAETRERVKTDPEALKPDILIFSNGDLPAFRLTLERDGTDHRATIAPDKKGSIAAVASAAESRS